MFIGESGESLCLSSFLFHLQQKFLIIISFNEIHKKTFWELHNCL